MEYKKFYHPKTSQNFLSVHLTFTVKYIAKYLIFSQDILSAKKHIRLYPLYIDL
jgi:hypothetical protein